MQELFSRVRLTEYLLSPYDGRRTEFVNGKILDIAEASPLHVFINAFIQQLLNSHIKSQGRSLFCFGPAGIEIPRVDDENNVRSPDKVVSDRTRWREMKHLTKAVFAAGNPPALAIEVASPGNTERDTVDKRQDYALAEVPEYWIVNPVDGYVLVLVLADGEYQDVGEYTGAKLISSRLFPDLKVSAATLLDPSEDDLLDVS